MNKLRNCDRIVRMKKAFLILSHLTIIRLGKRNSFSNFREVSFCFIRELVYPPVTARGGDDNFVYFSKNKNEVERVKK